MTLTHQHIQWSTDIASAPRGKTITKRVKTKDGFKDVTEVVPERVWLASVCGKVIPTYWVESRKNWASFQDTPPVAWHPYIVPEHPFAAAPGDAAVTPGNDLRKPVAAEQGQIIREGDAPRETDRASGDASCQDTTHFITDDCGSGA